MDETVNETGLFSEVDFADTQTENEASPTVQETNEQPTSQEETSKSAEVLDAKETQTGDEIERFLANKGIKSDDPDALRKVAEMYQNVEKDYGRKSQENAQREREIARLEQRLTEYNNSRMETPKGIDPLTRIQNLENQLAAERQVQAIKDWKSAKNLTPEAEAKMVEFLSQPIIKDGIPQTDPQGRPLTKFFLVQNGALSYDDVFRTVGGDSFKADTVKQELKTAVANEFAAKQNAKSSSTLATNSTQFAKPKTADDDFIAGLFG